MRAFILLCIFVLSATTVPASAFAQFDSASFGAPELGLELQPPYPRPGETIAVSLNDYQGGFYGATIDWLLDDRALPEVKNQRRITITADPNSAAQTLQAVLTSTNGNKRTLTSVIRPIYLDVVIEPQTRAPHFYLGRSLPSVGSMVNATALISGKGFRNPDLVYTWRLNRQVLEGGAVRGRNQVSFDTPMGSEMILSVQVAEPNGTVLASRAMLLPIVRPELLFYEVSPLFGMSSRPLSPQYTLLGNSTMVRAEPYHLDTRVYNDPDVSEWEINRVPVGELSGNPYEITLQRTTTGGASELNFHVRSRAQLLQGVEEDITINF